MFYTLYQSSFRQKERMLYGFATLNDTPRGQCEMRKKHDQPGDWLYKNLHYCLVGSIIHLRFFLLANLRCHPFFWLVRFHISPLEKKWRTVCITYPWSRRGRVACGRQRLLFIQGTPLAELSHLCTHFGPVWTFRSHSYLRRHSHSCKVKRKSFWCLKPFPPTRKPRRKEKNQACEHQVHNQTKPIHLNCH